MASLHTHNQKGAARETVSPAKVNDAFRDIEKLEADLWEAADKLPPR